MIHDLERRRLCAFTGASSMVNGIEVFTLTGSAQSDAITIATENGFYTHEGSDPGFVSKFDFDSAQSGEQRAAIGFAVTGTTPLVVNCGDGDDTVTIKNLTERDALGDVRVSGGDGNNSLILDATDATGPREQKLGISTYFCEGGEVIYGHFQHVALQGGRYGDELNIQGIFTDSTSVYGNGGDDIIMIGDNSGGIGLIDGGAGDNELTYRFDTNRVRIDATTGTGTFGVHFGRFDKFVGGESDDTIVGSSRNETIDGSGGSDSIIGNSGDDDLTGELIYGEAGNDTLHCQSEIGDQLYGEAGDDLLLGGSGSDLLDGGAGNDKLYGEHGDDTLRGDAGVDHLFGGKGDDLLLGGTSNDKLYGEGGNDTLIGQEQTDLIDGGVGDDVAPIDPTDTVKNVESLI